MYLKLKKCKNKKTESVNFHIKKWKIPPLPRSLAFARKLVAHLTVLASRIKTSILLTIRHLAEYRRVKLHWNSKIVSVANWDHQEVIMNVIRLYPPPGEEKNTQNKHKHKTLKLTKASIMIKKPKTKQNQIQNIKTITKTIARLLRKLRHNCVLHDIKT